MFSRVGRSAVHINTASSGGGGRSASDMRGRFVRVDAARRPGSRAQGKLCWRYWDRSFQRRLPAHSSHSQVGLCQRFECQFDYSSRDRDWERCNSAQAKQRVAGAEVGARTCAVCAASVPQARCSSQ